LGNVLVFFDNDLFFQRIEKHSPYSTAEMKAMSGQYIPFLQAFETGNISPEVFYKKSVKVLKAEIDQNAFFLLYNDVFSLNHRALKTLLSLKSGCRLVMLSNTDIERFGFIESSFPEILIFDEYVLSYETGSRKPQPEIYIEALDRSRAVPEECVFIDDLENNIQAASELGIRTIHFLPETDLKLELIDLGVAAAR